MINRLDFLEDAKINTEQFFDFGEQEICRQFGCGKKLSRQEKLFGDKCVEHCKSKTPEIGGIIKSSVFLRLRQSGTD